MRSAGNFHPEWGYLAPAPNFMRTARIVLVATAIGATAGAAVVLSLVGHPADDAGKTSVASTPVASHMLVTSAQAAAPPVVITAQPVIKSVPLSAPVTVAVQTPVLPTTDVQTSAQPIVQPVVASQSVTPVMPEPQAAAPAVSDASTVSTPGVSASGAVLAEIPPAVAAMPALGTDETATDPVQGQKKPTKKGHSAQRGEPGYGKPRYNNHGLAPILRHLFSARTSSSHYWN